MNKELMFSSNTDLWETPKDFFDQLNHRFGFTLDVCATKENAKCSNFFTKEIDGLKQEWNGIVWMNPPYGRVIKDWVKKAYVDSVEKRKCTVVALLPARTDTKWFHDFIYNKNKVEVEFIKGRLKFGGAINNAPFPSMIAIFNHSYY